MDVSKELFVNFGPNKDHLYNSWKNCWFFQNNYEKFNISIVTNINVKKLIIMTDYYFIINK